MNVLQIVPELNAGGVERTTLEIVQALTAAGHTPHIASLGGRLEAELLALGGVLHKFHVGSKNPLKLRANTQRLIQIIKDHNIDIVHARSRAPAWPAYGAAKSTHTPFITTYHGIYNAKQSLKRRYNAIMTRGELIIANSKFTKAHIIEEHKISPEKIIVIPRGVDMHIFDPAIIKEPDKIAQLKAWNLPPHKTCLLLPGRLTRWKGQIIALKAMRQLSEDYVLICQGDPQGRTDYVNELSSLAAQWGLRERVRFPGHTNHLPVALSCADIIISASTDPEAFGRVAIEAQAMERPIIASAHGGSLETIKDGQTGLLVPPQDAQALALAIQTCAKWTDYKGEAARAHIMENFSKRHMQMATLDVYRQVLS